MVIGKYYFFWKHKISQWGKDVFVDENHILYNCCEQYMMYQKAKLFKDEETAKKILFSDDPKTIKDLGRVVKNFDQKVWDEHKEDIVYKGNYLRFSQSPYSKQALFDTAPYELVEASPYDRVWGIGLDVKANNVDDDRTWLGQNLLGKILTKVRNDLMKG